MVLIRATPEKNKLKSSPDIKLLTLTEICTDFIINTTLDISHLIGYQVSYYTIHDACIEEDRHKQTNKQTKKVCVKNTHTFF